MATSFSLNTSAESYAGAVITNELQLGLATGTSGRLVQSQGSASQAVHFLWLTTANQPNSGDWPNASYKAQLDVTSAGANITYGFLSINGANGAFGRTNTTVSLAGAVFQSEAAFSGAGLKLGTVAWDPNAGATSDRFLLVLATRNTAAMAQDLSLALGNTASSYALWGEVSPTEFPERTKRGAGL